MIDRARLKTPVSDARWTTRLGEVLTREYCSMIRHWAKNPWDLRVSAKAFTRKDLRHRPKLSCLSPFELDSSVQVYARQSEVRSHKSLAAHGLSAPKSRHFIAQSVKLGTGDLGRCR